MVERRDGTRIGKGADDGREARREEGESVRVELRPRPPPAKTSLETKIL